MLFLCVSPVLWGSKERSLKYSSHASQYNPGFSKSVSIFSSHRVKTLLPEYPKLMILNKKMEIKKRNYLPFLVKVHKNRLPSIQTTIIPLILKHFLNTFSNRILRLLTHINLAQIISKLLHRLLVILTLFHVELHQVKLIQILQQF